MIDKTISHYKIIKILGKGGMGEVYLAQDTKLNRQVAIKFLPSQLAVNESDKARFLQEAQAAAAINHPNVCIIHDIQEYDQPETAEKKQFIVMEYVEGKTLRDVIDAKYAGQSQMSMNEVIDYAIQIGEALQEAHNKDIIHRDIKSENIMVNTKSQVKVMDFGLAKLKGTVKLTKSISTTGTLAYMAPEHLQGSEPDSRSDIFSFAIVLYEMLTGKLPFKGDYESALMYSIINEDPEPVQKYRAELSSEFLHVLNRALEKKPEERYQSVTEMLIDLKRLKRDTSRISKESPREIPVSGISEKLKLVVKSRQKFFWIGAVTMAVLLVLVAIWLLNQRIFQDHADFVPDKENSIAVMYFENRSGEQDLEKNIVSLLTTNLSRYDQLEVVSSQRLFDILKSIGKKDVEVIDRSVATEIATRAQVKTMLLGNIIKIGNKTRISTELCDVQTGSNIGSEYVESESLEDVFNMVDDLTEKVVTRLGLRSVGSADRTLKIEDVTTSSYEAYNYFRRGREDYEKFYYEDARRFLEKAIELDPQFTIAYLLLAYTHSALGDIDKSRLFYEKAKLFSEKATEKERLYIEASYASAVERDIEKRYRILMDMAVKYPKEKLVFYNLGLIYQNSKRLYAESIEAYTKALELDPGFGPALNDLAYAYIDLGNFTKAIEYFKKYASVSPGDANPIDSMADVYFLMGRIGDALTKYKEALEIKPDFGSDMKISYIYALREDYDEAIKWIDQFTEMMPSPGLKADGYFWKAFYFAWLGRSDSSFILLGKAEEISDSFNKAMIDYTKGWIYYNLGEYEQSKEYLQRGFDYFINFLPERKTIVANYHNSQGLVDIAQGRFDLARSRLDTIKSCLTGISPEYKKDVSRPYDVLNASLLLAEGADDEAITILEKVTPPKLTAMVTVSLMAYNLHYKKDYLARAYKEAGKLDKAITEYIRIITIDPNSKDRRLIHPKYHYNLAKLYEEKGWKDKAIEQYEKCLKIWKDADEDLAGLIDTKERLTILTDSKR